MAPKYLRNPTFSRYPTFKTLLMCQDAPTALARPGFEKLNNCNGLGQKHKSLMYDKLPMFHIVNSNGGGGITFPSLSRSIIINSWVVYVNDQKCKV